MSAKSEGKNEQDKMVSFELKGEKYEFSRDTLNDLDILENLEDENYILACRAILGRRQWATFKNSHRGDNGKIEGSVMDSLMDSIMAALDPTPASDD